jgi:hypothetical protein
MEVSEAMQTEFSVSDSDSGQSRRTAAKFRTTGSADAVVSLTRDFQSKAMARFWVCSTSFLVADGLPSPVFVQWKWPFFELGRVWY